MRPEPFQVSANLEKWKPGRFQKFRFPRFRLLSIARHVGDGQVCHPQMSPPLTTRQNYPLLKHRRAGRQAIYRRQAGFGRAGLPAQPA